MERQVWELKPAREEDEAFLISLHAVVHGGEFATLPLPPAQLRQLLHGQYLAGRGAYISAFGESGHSIVWSGSTAIGRIWVYRTETEIRLVDILLLPGFRRKGIGTALIRSLQSESDGRPVTLQVASHNTAAIRLYERLGFRPEVVSGLHLSMRWVQATRI